MTLCGRSRHVQTLTLHHHSEATEILLTSICLLPFFATSLWHTKYPFFITLLLHHHCESTHTALYYLSYCLGPSKLIPILICRRQVSHPSYLNFFSFVIGGPKTYVAHQQTFEPYKAYLVSKQEADGMQTVVKGTCEAILKAVPSANRTTETTFVSISKTTCFVALDKTMHNRPNQHPGAQKRVFNRQTPCHAFKSDIHSISRVGKKKVQFCVGTSIPFIPKAASSQEQTLNLLIHFQPHQPLHTLSQNTAQHPPYPLLLLPLQNPLNPLHRPLNALVRLHPPRLLPNRSPPST